jgi:nucleotide-binding universal stress UspA family protein
MIHTVAVLAGDGAYAEAAQQHALQIARWFQARVRVVTIWEPKEARGATVGGLSLESLAEMNVEKVASEARNDHVPLEASVRAEGCLKGLLAEARESDLLVVGLPLATTKAADPLLQAIRHAELPLLHKAECLILVVYQSPRPIRKIMVDYQGGIEGKTALRAAGEVALRTSAAVTVLSMDLDPGDAGVMAATAASYLGGFGLSSVETISRVGQPESAMEVVRAAESTEADLLVVGGERHGLLHWLRDRATPDPEDVALSTHIPVLIAR